MARVFRQRGAHPVLRDGVASPKLCLFARRPMQKQSRTSPNFRWGGSPESPNQSRYRVLVTYRSRVEKGVQRRFRCGALLQRTDSAISASTLPSWLAMIVLPCIPAVCIASRSRAGTEQQGHACASIVVPRHAISDPVQPRDNSGGARAGARAGRDGHGPRRGPQPRPARYTSLRDLPTERRRGAVPLGTRAERRSRGIFYVRSARGLPVARAVQAHGVDPLLRHLGRNRRVASVRARASASRRSCQRMRCSGVSTTRRRSQASYASSGSRIRRRSSCTRCPTSTASRSPRGCSSS